MQDRDSPPAVAAAPLLLHLIAVHDHPSKSQALPHVDNALDPLSRLIERQQKLRLHHPDHTQWPVLLASVQRFDALVA